MSMKIRLALHKNVQKELVARLIGQKVSIEKRFRVINRIADVYWHEANIVFEVQCSHIPQHEAIERTADYKSIGITVIWLLHDKTFNRKILTRAELYLRKHLALYTNIDGLKKGNIYNQEDICLYRTRIKRGQPIQVDILNTKTLLTLLPSQPFKRAVSFKERYNNFLTKLYRAL
jgi:competence CoiA-like predicted nuclease